VGHVAPLGAILTAIVTPFDDRLDVDERAFVDLLDHLAGHGSDGFVVAGTTGEATTLTDDEHLRLIELAVRERPEGATIVAGTGSNDTRHAVEMTRRATELGVDAILSVTPYYNRPNRRGIVRHFQEIAKATDRPIVLYNIPSRTGTDMPNDLLAELGQLENVVAVKQANAANLALIDGLELYAGNDENLADVLEMGGAGGILVASHLVGDHMRRMVDEPEQRRQIEDDLKPLYAALGRHNPVPLKAALGLLGICSPAMRLPYVQPDEEQLTEIREALTHQGLLEAAGR
jgi:4-hydroxy-tetrahydrodipicolinate synthase